MEPLLVSRVAASALRCPFCHGDLETRRDDRVACRGCLARHHAACWRELGRCATCGRREHDLDPTRTWARTAHAASRRAERIGWILTGAFLGSLVGVVLELVLMLPLLIVLGSLGTPGAVVWTGMVVGLLISCAVAGGFVARDLTRPRSRAASRSCPSP